MSGAMEAAVAAAGKIMARRIRENERLRVAFEHIDAAMREGEKDGEPVVYAWRLLRDALKDEDR